MKEILMIQVITNIEFLKKLQPYITKQNTKYYIDTRPSPLEPVIRGKNEITPDVYREIYDTLTLPEIINFIHSQVSDEWKKYINDELSKHIWDSFSVLIIFDLKFAEKILNYLIDNHMLKK